METFLQWLKQNPDLVQAFAALAIAALTALLIVVTGFYAWTTWKTLGVLRADFEARMRIDVRITLRAKTGKPEGGYYTGPCYMDVSNLSPFGIWVESIDVIAEFEGVAGQPLLMPVKFMIPAFTPRPIDFGGLFYDAFMTVPNIPQSKRGYEGKVTVTASCSAHGKTHWETVKLGKLLALDDGTITASETTVMA